MIKYFLHLSTRTAIYFCVPEEFHVEEVWALEVFLN